MSFDSVPTPTKVHPHALTAFMYDKINHSEETLSTEGTSYGVDCVTAQPTSASYVPAPLGIVKRIKIERLT